jgi:hypothetical protein
MILRQFLHSDPVAVSYLFRCAGHTAPLIREQSAGSLGIAQLAELRSGNEQRTKDGLQTAETRP